MLFRSPLVINLDSNVTTLSDQKFMFDIDSDGILDSISYLNKGSGYLALDKNGDGVINDGNELFGTKSGDGFYDLSRYDEDHNGIVINTSSSDTVSPELAQIEVIVPANSARIAL